MSEKITVHGRCGKELTCKLWKQGGSVKCPEKGWSIVSYPRPSELQIYQDIMDLCEGCPSIDSDKLRRDKDGC